MELIKQIKVRMIDQVMKYLNLFFGLKKYAKAPTNNTKAKSANIGEIAV